MKRTCCFIVVFYCLFLLSGIVLVQHTEAAPKIKKKFSFTVQHGIEISAIVIESKELGKRKFISFDPFIEKTDGNLLMAALELFMNLYPKGKMNPIFSLKNAKLQYDAQSGGNAVCWHITAPKKKFCILPVKDETTGNFASMTAWVE